MMVFDFAESQSIMVGVLTKLTIDKLGRIVLPKPVREKLQLSAGDELELESLDDRITLRPLRGTAQLRKNAVSGSPIPASRFRPRPSRRPSSKCAANATIPELCRRGYEQGCAVAIGWFWRFARVQRRSIGGSVVRFASLR
jgi:AbrB family looped-hinge helix DNA binding protein